TMWLPRRRTSKKPFSIRILQVSIPESTRSLPNLYLDPSDEHLAAQAMLNLTRIGRFQKELERLDEVRACFFDCPALAGNIQFGAEGEIAISFPFDDCRKLACAAQIRSSARSLAPERIGSLFRDTSAGDCQASPTGSRRRGQAPARGARSLPVGRRRALRERSPGADEPAGRNPSGAGVATRTGRGKPLPYKSRETAAFKPSW